MTSRTFDGSDPDYSAEAEQGRVDESVARIRAQAAAIPAGSPGVCIECEAESPRLVRNRCARCRDLLKLP